MGEQSRFSGPEVMARVRRMASLRAAQRVLAFSVRSLDPLAGADDSRPVRQLLQPLVDQLEVSGGRARGEAVAPDGVLDQVDSLLDGIEKRLLDAASSVSLPQFRASLSGLSDDLRREALALLDLCLAGDGLADRLALVDLLVTRLSTAEQAGLRTVTSDPADLTPRLRELCAEAELAGREIQAEATAFLCEAAERVQKGGDVEALVREVSEFKRSIAPHFFAPEILRCIVFYNVAAGNHREERMREAREEDRTIDELAGAATAVTPQPALVWNDARRSGGPAARQSVFDVYGLDAVEEACERRFRNEPPLPTVSSDVAASFRLVGMSRPDIEMFLSPVDEGIVRLLRRVVTVGLAVEHFAEVREQLAELEIDVGLLTGAWISELGDAVQAHIDSVIAEGDFDEANRLSDLKTRFLYAPLSKLRREERTTAPAAAAVTNADASEMLRSWDDSAPNATVVRSEPAEAEERRARPRRWRLAALCVVLLALLGYSVATHLGDQEGRFRVFSSGRAAEVSKFLVSAYRSENGRGPLFVGTLSEGWWDQLEPEERLALGNDIAGKLGEDGVREVLLYDSRRALRMRAVSGRVTFPGESGR